MAEQGFRLIIPNDVLRRLEIADEKIADIARNSELASTRIVKAFQVMATDGVDAFVKKLEQAQQVLNSLRNANGSSINLGNIATQATQSADSINTLIATIIKLTQENNNLKNSFLGLTDKQIGKLSDRASTLNYKAELNAIREKINIESERERELIKQDKRNQRRHAETMASLREEIKEINRFARAYAQIPKSLSTKDVGKLIARSVQSDNSINQNITAIKNLEKAKKDLDTTDKRYQQTLDKLNSEIARHKDILLKLGVNVDKVKNSHRGLMDISSQLARRLALVFSVSQITGYVNKLVSIRGEFELQQRSLQAILQNKDEANKLWQQTVDLAVRSPFRVKELVTYTKQLAAYRIETEKLHDTTKMLSDISAGLGVDMQRLILAYGQVKAANYLRGTELRQFSEAGINILGELATYFTEVKGQIISVGDVFEMVSKRMVTFADVETIFKRLTSAGGTFYRMQEIQSNTLKGMISNLKDSIDLMLNEIGMANEGVLKDMVSLIKTLVDNWRIFAAVLKQATLAMGMMGVANFVNGWKLVATQGQAAALAMNGIAGMGARVNVALKTLGATISAHPILMLVGILASAGHLLYEHAKSIEESNKRYDEASEIAFRQREELYKLQTQIQNNNKAINDSNDALAKAKTNTNEYTIAKNKLNNAEKTSDELYKQLKTKYPDIIGGIIQQKDKTIELANAVELYNHKVTTQIALNEQAKGGWTYESTATNYEDLLNTQAKVQSILTQLQSFTASALTKADIYKDVIPEDTFNQLTELSNKVINSTTENIASARKELVHFIYNTQDLPKELVKVFKDNNIFFDLAKQVNKYNERWVDFEENLNRMLPSFQRAKRTLSFETEDQQKEAGRYFNSLLDGLGIVDEEIRKSTQDWIEYNLAVQGKIDWSAKSPVDATSVPTITEDENAKATQILAQRIDVIKDLNSAYKNLAKTFDQVESKERVIESYLNTFNPLFENLGISINDIKFDSIDGVISALQRLLPTVKEGTMDWVKLNKVISEFATERDVDLKVKDDKTLLTQIEDMFSSYEISLELQKLNIPPDLAKQLFNVASLTLPELKEQVLKLKPQFEGKDMLDEWDKLMKRINEMEIKAQEERLKTYTKYLVKAQSERVQIKLEEMRQLEEVEKENAYTPEQKSVIKQAIRDETQSKIDKQIWKDFQNTTLYIQMFDELEYVSTNALKKMRSELLNMRDSLKNLEPSELKEIQDKLAAIGDEIVDRNPFEGLSTSLKDGIKALKTLDEQQEKFNKAQANEDKAKELVDTLQLQVEETRKRNAELKATSAFNKGTEVILDSQLKTQEKQLEVAIEEYAVAKGITKEEAKRLLLLQQTISEANKKLNKVGSIGGDITGMANDVISALGNWGIEVSDEFTQILGGIGKTFDSLAEINFTEPMSIIKGVVGALVGISDMLAGIFVGTNDAMRERQIQRELKLVKDLEKSYKKLEKAIENAYDVDTLKKAYDDANNSINQQISARHRAIKLEEDKKNTDNDRIKEWQGEIEDLREQKDKLLKEQVENLGGGYDFASITEEFVNAWLNAFKETGNGLSGLEENFADFWQNVAIKQAVMGGASKILEPFLNEVNKALENDFTISDSEMANIDTLGEDAKAKLDAFLQQWYGKWGDMIGDTEQGDLSGLQAGIKSITEEQAAAIEAYLNSIRFFVAQNNTMLATLVSAFTNSDTPNPILSELRSQSEMIRAIRDMFSSVIGRGNSNHSGAYLKVAM